MKKVSNDLEVSNIDATGLLKFYPKVLNTSFKDFDLALNIADDAIKLEDAVKAYSKLEKIIIEKANTSEDKSEEFIRQINSDLMELGNKKVTIKDGLTKIPKDILLQMEIKPIEIIQLRKFELY